jgi:glycosyltransferase involved in cell wall biosynthesis
MGVPEAMKRYAIITHVRREDGYAGGVPKWAHYLKRALEEAGHEVRHFTWADYPEAGQLAGSPDTALGFALSAWVGREAHQYRWIVADGFWGAGLPDGAPAIIVAHGLWAGYEAAIGGVPSAHLAVQAAIYRRFPVVAVSQSAASDLQAYHQVRAAAVVPNGVDLDLFKPDGHARGRLVRHACRGRAKGGDVIDRIARALDGTARVEYLDAAIGCEPTRFAAADACLHPSRYEGDSYACLEALACGVPLVYSFVGRWLGDPEDPRVGRGLAVGAPTAAWVEALEAVLGDPDAPARARQYAQERADYREFARRWLKVLEA